MILNARCQCPKFEVEDDEDDHHGTLDVQYLVNHGKPSYGFRPTCSHSKCSDPKRLAEVASSPSAALAETHISLEASICLRVFRFNLEQCPEMNIYSVV